MGQSCSVGDDPANNALTRGHAPGLPLASGSGFESGKQSPPIHSAGLMVSRVGGSPSLGGWQDGWRHWYALGRELGRGISATVYEAEAVFEMPGCAVRAPSMGGLCNARMVQPCTVSSHGRRVALKRFKKVGSRSFQTELAAILRVGVHPNVLRLLESYEDCDGEDALVLEYCDGRTVFDAYAAAHRNGVRLSEMLVARCIRQVLQALDHISSCGVEHQDVKPENMLLFGAQGGTLTEQHVHLKLGDFGWAKAMAVPGGPELNTDVPADGAGSLWYAPPELNPPVKSLGQTHLTRSKSMWVVGRSDMWSVGVVCYLLLVGHNPFNSARQHQESKAVEQAVLRMAATADFDQTSRRWLELPEDARNFISSLLQVSPAMRPPSAEVLRHPFLVRAAPPEAAFGSGGVFQMGPSVDKKPLAIAGWADKEDAWSRLDDFQRLCWVAVARAVAEPELSPEVLEAAARALHSSAPARPSIPGDSAYLRHLARELAAATPRRPWLRETSAWQEVLRLAFRYLDADGDGCLSAQDLALHLAAGPTDCSAEAQIWLARWCGEDAGPGNLAVTALPGSCSPGRSGTRVGGRIGGIGPGSFRAALAASSWRDTISRCFDDGPDDALSEGLEDTRSTVPGSRKAKGKGSPGRRRSASDREETTEELCAWAEWRG